METGEIIEVDLSVIRKISPLEWNLHVSFELLVCEEENPHNIRRPVRASPSSDGKSSL